MGIQRLKAGHFAGLGNITVGNATAGEDLATILNSYLGALFGPGLVLYVDGKNGTDATVAAEDRYPSPGWGTSWDRPFKTIQAALVVARGAGTGSNPSLDSNYDQDHMATILVAAGQYPETLIMVGAGIRLIGCGYPGVDRGVSVIPPDMSGSYPGSMIIQGSGLELGNIKIVNDYAYPTIWFDLMHSSWVHDMVLYGDGSATEGFRTNGMKNSIFERNRISMFATAGFRKYSNADYLIGSIIRDNYIGKGAGTGILIDAGHVMYDSYIERNRVEGNGLTLGIDNNCTGGIMITDNDVMITANTAPIESASTNGGLINNRVVYNAGQKRIAHFPADA